VIEANDQISLYQIPSHEGGILNSKTFLFADEGAVIYLSTAINPGEPKEDMINIRVFDVRRNAPELIVDIQTHRLSLLNKEDVYTTSDFTSQQLDMLKTLITEAKPITVDGVNKFFASQPAS